MSESDKYLGIVCPMANEGPDAVRFAQAVLEQCQAVKRVTFFAIFDRATKDDSLELLREYEKDQPRLKVVWAPENHSVVDAYVRGYTEALSAGCEWILEIDAGFSHQPSDISQFLARMDGDYDCVFGSRFMKGGAISDASFKRYVVSRGGTILANLMLGTRLTDMTSGFEMFSHRALAMVLHRGIHSRAHFFQTEIKFHCRHLKILEVPILYKSPSPRLGSASLKDAFRQLWRLSKQRNKESEGTQLEAYPNRSSSDVHLPAESDIR